ncbi:hypothetical protein [Spirosoma spitsbergense]|uniref:hypothetical protein n=1 Tax=Spirosoma spitsbergense TaxID=431554 RepID=UPI00036BC787|nr:hypothetical protein [Spirosoma spitsbergense]
MSDIIIYGFFGEDEAQRNFLAKYLAQCFPDRFVEDETFRWRIKVRGRDQVDAFLPEALLQKAIFRLEFLFVGRDVDTAHEPTIQLRRNTFEKICKDHQPVVLMLPVQCIEHWLWYIKRRHEEPGKKSLLESQPRSLAKQAVYGGCNSKCRYAAIA